MPGVLATFDRTYEGLKPLMSIPFSAISKTFDRTYEGLKPMPWKATRKPSGSSFDRTYEGLKHLELGLGGPHEGRF